MNQLVVFFSTNKKGERLVGIGLTDKLIAKLKDTKVILEPASHTGTDTDIILFHGTTLNELMAEIHKYIPKEQTVEKIL